MDWQDKIISLYLFICDEYKSGLWAHCQRFSNNSNLIFSDEEVATIYMCGIMEGLITKKQIYKHTKNYWSSLFPYLPNYEAFVQRINKLGNFFVGLINNLQQMLPIEIFDE